MDKNAFRVFRKKYADEIESIYNHELNREVNYQDFVLYAYRTTTGIWYPADVYESDDESDDELVTISYIDHIIDPETNLWYEDEITRALTREEKSSIRESNIEMSIMHAMDKTTDVHWAIKEYLERTGSSEFMKHSTADFLTALYYF